MRRLDDRTATGRLLFIALAISACGPAGGLEGELQVDGPSVRANRGDGGVGDREPPPPAPELAALQTAIFVPMCATSGCHAAPNPAEELDFTVPAAELAVRLREPARQSPTGMRLIEPGSPGASYLYLKVFLSTPLIGDRMPSSDNPLTLDDLELLRRYVEGMAE